MNLMAVSQQNNILFIVTENKLSAFQIHNDGKIKDFTNSKIYKVSEDNVKIQKKMFFFLKKRKK